MAGSHPPDFIRLVRDHAEQRRHQLSSDVVHELAEHLEDVYDSQLDQAGSDDALAAVVALLERTDYDELTQRSRAVARDVAPGLAPDVAQAVRPAIGLAFDLRYAFRSMRRERTYSLAVIAILAVGIGATTAGFTVIDTVLIRPLPYPDAQQLVVLKHVTPAGETRSHAAADWRDYAAAHARTMMLAAYASWPMNVTGGGGPERLRSVIVSGNFFDVIGERSALGRVSNAVDDQPSAPGVVVLSDGFWRRRFGADRSIVGGSLVLNGRPATIVGVMPPGFAIPDRTVDLWMPMGVPSAVLDDRVSEWLSIIGRLRPGVGVRAAQTELQTTSGNLAALYPKTNAGERVTVRPLLDDIVGGVRRALWLGGLAVLFVLLAGAANAANLMIARATLRRDEVAIRSALGAAPWRIARQLIVEALLLAACGCVLGIGAAVLFDRAFIVLGDGRVPRIDRIALSGPSIAVAIAAAIVAVLLCGGTAAWLVVRRCAASNRYDARVIRSNHVGETLLAVQVSFAVVLLAGAVLVARGYAATVAIDPGFDAANTLTMQVTLARGRYPDTAAHTRFAERALAELRSIPGVKATGVVSDLPLVANALHFPVRLDGSAGDGERMTVRPADAGFFETLRIAVAVGRSFTSLDRRGAPLVALVNQPAARRLTASDDSAAVGARIVVDREPARVIVGVVGEIKHAGLRADEGPVVYVPFAQKTFDFLNWMGFVVRGAEDTPSGAVVREALAKVDPNQPLSAVRSMQEYLDAQSAPYRFSALIVFVLAGAALLLAVTGIFGMTAFIVGRRTRELGIRLALGATRRSVVALVLRHVQLVFTAGCVAGLGAAAVTNTLLQTTLADTPTIESSVAAMAIGGLVLLVTALAAALLPALRAARIDVTAVLQAE